MENRANQRNHARASTIIDGARCAIMRRKKEEAMTKKAAIKTGGSKASKVTAAKAAKKVTKAIGSPVQQKAAKQNATKQWGATARQRRSLSRTRRDELLSRRRSCRVRGKNVFRLPLKVMCVAPLDVRARCGRMNADG